VEWWSILSDVSLDIIRFIEAGEIDPWQCSCHGSTLEFNEFSGRFQLFFCFSVFTSADLYQPSDLLGVPQ
jgi:hypothetical protein